MAQQTLSASLHGLLETEADHLTIGTIVERVGDRGFGLLLLVLSLPSALPVPAAGYSVPFGIILLFLAGQMLAGRRRPVFPARMERVKLGRRNAERLLRGGERLFRFLEWIVRPRLRWIGSRGGRSFMGVLVLVMALLMMIPIPMTNTFPALVIFLIGVGLTEEDGLFAIAACMVGVLAVLLYGALIYAIIAYGPEIVTTIKDAIRSVLP